MAETLQKTKKKAGRKKHRAGRIVLAVLGVLILAIVITDVVVCHHRSDPDHIQTYDTQNPYVLEQTDISGHRSGGGIEPEETLRAFKNCAENPDFSIDVFEFDLHVTKDDVLVLLHDDTVDRTSDSQQVFGEKDVRPENKTYDELRQLNMGAQFETESGEKPYANLHGDQVPDDLRILRVEDALDYLIVQGKGEYKYIIEIKNSGDLGTHGVDLLYNIMKERGIIDRVIFGTFHKEVSAYVDATYQDMTRSTSIAEVAEFWAAALRNDENYTPPCKVLQIPYCAPYKNLGFNLGTATVINYAHAHDMAVQYWTVNDPEDMAYLVDLGADCIMSDYPDKLYDTMQEKA